MVYHNSRQRRGVRCSAPLWISPKAAGTAALQNAAALFVALLAGESSICFVLRQLGSTISFSSKLARWRGGR